LTPTFRGSVDSFAVGLKTLESAELAGLLYPRGSIDHNGIG
jgi:hypothetical protein